METSIGHTELSQVRDGILRVALSISLYVYNALELPLYSYTLYPRALEGKPPTGRPSNSAPRTVLLHISAIAIYIIPSLESLMTISYIYIISMTQLYNYIYAI